MKSGGSRCPRSTSVRNGIALSAPRVLKSLLGSIHASPWPLLRDRISSSSDNHEVLLESSLSSSGRVVLPSNRTEQEHAAYGIGLRHDTSPQNGWWHTQAFFACVGTSQVPMSRPPRRKTWEISLPTGAGRIIFMRTGSGWRVGT